MSSGVAPGNAIIVSAFQSALLRQALVVLVVLVLLAIAWSVLRSMQLRLAVGNAGPAVAGSGGTAGSPALAANGAAAVPAQAPVALQPPTRLGAVADPEPSARRFLRIGFGLLWVFDGILQGQTSMPLGMTTRVIGPTVAASPEWVRHIVGFGTTIWNDHPIAASTAVVWIQLGLGLWLLVAPRGRWSRGAGAASVVWGLVVWVFGEAFGGLFAPGVSWLFGAPGAVLFYCAAGWLIALDERRWASPRLGRLILRCMGVFFLAMAVLQAWPGRGFWQGSASASGRTGALASMVETMAKTPQPHFVSSWLSSFAGFTAAHGFAVNLFVVAVLAAIGLVLCFGRPAALRWGVIAAAVVCLADWVVVQDLGFLGGTGTDPNSMIPMLLLIAAGYLATLRTAAATEMLSPDLELPANLEPDLGWMSDPPPPERAPNWRERVRARPVYAFRVLATLGAVVVVLLGVAPMAAASLNRSADPIVSQALDGSPVPVDLPAPGFVLRDQYGRPVSLVGLRGKVVVLTFIDPVGMEDAPVVAQELRQSSQSLGREAEGVEFVAVTSNPLYRSRAVLQAFDGSQGLATMTNWLLLTGRLPSLRGVWSAYGIESVVGPRGFPLVSTYRVFVIDANGRERWRLNNDPLTASTASESSFAEVLSLTVQRVLNSG